MPDQAVAYADSAIAIVGLAARLPGADDVDRYWRNLREGVESVVHHTPAELLRRGVDPAIVADPDFVPASACLAHADCFDASFFGYSAREASIMDPQHRVFLECAQHALESAAYDPDRYQGLIGVYAGSTMNTYLLYNVMSHKDSVRDAVGDLQTMVGNDKEYLPTRVSYKLNLRGPSVAVQTACSSSLVAVHMACQALISEDCDMALAGGASVRMPLHAGYMANPGGTASADGHCRAFDADAAGSVVGSGVGIVVLKRLTDAVRDGDTISAVILGSAINNDGGAKASFTAPSVDGQSRAIIRSLRKAGISARDLAYVEAHGTGTPIGDPIEVAALTRAFRTFTDDRAFCWLSSVKPNIGHLDAAAGIAGLIKTVLVLKNRMVPPTVNFRRANPMLKLDTSPFQIPAELVPLAAAGGLYAAVNSLAMGGTNAHVVLATPPQLPAARSPRARHVIVLSARTADALEQLSQRVAASLPRRPEESLPDVGFSLAAGRRTFAYRRLVVAAQLEDAELALSTDGSPRRRDGRAAPEIRLGMLFPGQGSQYRGMATALAAAEPLFRDRLMYAIELCDGAVRAKVADALLGAPAADDDTLLDTAVTQPALFALQWAYASAIMDFGTEVCVLLGHSLGELVAATVAGVFSPSDAIRIVHTRGELMAAAEPGRMLYAFISGAQAAELAAASGCAVAAVNGPASVTFAGRAAQIEALETELASRGHRFGAVRVGHAFHSPLMDDASRELTRVLTEVTMSAPRLPVVSNLTGEVLTADDAADPQYWGQQLRQCVQFATGIQTARSLGATSFLEVGPADTLTRLVEAAAPGEFRFFQGITARPVPARSNDLLDCLAQMWLAGLAVDWTAQYRGEARRRLPLPGYPFARERHWLDVLAGGQAAHAVAAAPATAGGQAGAAAPPLAAAVAGPVTGPAAAPVAVPTSIEGIEQYLRVLWTKLLGTGELDGNANFFDLGGHSLLATQMVSAIRQDLFPGMAMVSVFEAPTIRGLARTLHAEMQAEMHAEIQAAREPGSTAAATASSMSDETSDRSAPIMPTIAGSGENAAPDQQDADLIDRIAGMSDSEVMAELAKFRGEHERGDES